MQITQVKPWNVSYPEPNDSGNTRYLTFCSVEADDGTVGWGEAITQFPESTRATARLIEAMGEQLLGADPMQNVALWRKLHQHSWWYGYEGGPACFAISAIDIALWDLKGKLLGQPVVNLIGGAYRDRLPVIASTHAFDESLEREAEKHGRYVREQGYQGVKVGMGKRGQARLGYNFDRDVGFVRLLREAIGPDALLIMDRGQSLVWTRAEAIKRTNAFEECGLYWIEEPMEPTDTAGFLSLRAQAKCLIGTGEREWNAKGVRPGHRERGRGRRRLRPRSGGRHHRLAEGHRARREGGRLVYAARLEQRGHHRGPAWRCPPPRPVACCSR